MTLVQSLLGFGLAAGLLTITPGLDTALVLRTAAGEGRGAALRAAMGIQLGCLVWGAAVALGLGALLQASAVAYTALTWTGAAYLAVIGVQLILRPRRAFAFGPAERRGTGMASFRRGLLTNLLNPKIGVFYLSFLPQFVPTGYPAAPSIFGLAVLHDLIGSSWFVLLILGLGRMGPLLRRPGFVAWLDRGTGAVFILFGLRLVMDRRVLS